MTMAGSTLADAPIIVVRASASDQSAIAAMVRGERLNPNGIHWQNFVVAKDGTRVIGAAQLRCHRDGSQELGSLVVVPEKRGAGLAGRLIGTLLTHNNGLVYMVTGQRHASHYARWGFEPVRPFDAPQCVLRNYCLGQSIGGAHALLTGRPVNRLVVLRRSSS